MADEISSINRNKRKFDVLKYFTEEWTSEDCKIACCRTCKKTMPYGTATKVSRTDISRLKQHVADGCMAVLSGDNNQSEMARGTTSAQYFDTYCQDLAWMIIIGDHRLDIVERPEFICFAKGLLPRFTINFDVIQKFCLETYTVGRETLLQALPGEISLSMDLWRSPRYVGYVFITASYMDNEWRLHKCLLSVILEPNPNSPNTFSHALGTCMLEWRLEKLFSLTVNQALNDAATDDLRRLLSSDRSMLFNGQLLVRRCIFRTLTQIAKDLLCIGGSAVTKVRCMVANVVTSDARREIFQVLVPTESSLPIGIDDRTEWNTTYNMLAATLEMRECLKNIVDTDEALEGLSEDDWKEVEVLSKHLKLLFDAANLFTITNAHGAVIFEQLWKIYSELCVASVSDDHFTSQLKRTLMVAVEKYLKDFSIILGASIAMDPRFKLQMVNYSFEKIYGEESSKYIQMVSDGIQQIYDEHVELPTFLTDFELYVSKSNDEEKLEVCRYLRDPLTRIKDKDLDLLGWWKRAEVVYPTFSKVAQRILSISFSTVTSLESIFSVKKKKMDDYRSSLHPKTVEAIICCKDWRASKIL